ncbi:MAG: N-acetylmuramoyl-L-alanine amidase, partial [Firmicutes bacterium]|nr:N-acetylmuramoyl-L-alanine amidase [Bacillota bacterium]
PDGREAWVYSPLVDRELPPDTLFVITAARANIRRGPTTSEALLGSVAKGTTLPASLIRDKWVRVTWAGKQAWIHADLGTLKRLDPSDLEVGDVPRSAEVIAATPIRADASGSAAAMATLKKGTILKYLNAKGGWVQVQWNGKTGWIQSAGVKVYNQVPFVRSVNYTITQNEWAITRYPIGRVKGSYVNLRSGPGTGYKKLGQLAGGRYFKILESRGGWYHVLTDKGEQGWVSAALALISYDPAVRAVSLKAESPQRKQLVIEGKFGTPIVRQVNDGTSLAVWFQNQGSGEARVDVNTFDLGRLSMNDNGIRLDFLEKTSVRVVQAVAGRVVVLVETSVTGVTVKKNGERELVVVETLGYSEPQVRGAADGKGLEVVIPGAVLAGTPSGSGRLVQEVKAAPSAQGVVVSVKAQAWWRHIARRTAGGFAVEFLEPGLKNKTIVIDPGHGGTDPGAIGPGGLQEKVPNLKISVALKSLLEKAGARVVMTRTDDSSPSAANGKPENSHADDLSLRVAMAASSGADLFLSIHNNANNDRSKSGSTVYYAASSLNAEPSRVLSEALQSQLVAALERTDNGVRKAEHFVSRMSPVPAAIAEVVYISNPEEESLLRSSDFCKRAATALFNGLKKYYS